MMPAHPGPGRIPHTCRTMAYPHRAFHLNTIGSYREFVASRSRLLLYNCYRGHVLRLCTRRMHSVSLAGEGVGTCLFRDFLLRCRCAPEVARKKRHTPCMRQCGDCLSTDDAIPFVRMAHLRPVRDGEIRHGNRAQLVEQCSITVAGTGEA